MQYIQHKTEVEITGLADFDLQQTFECGQCFRWNRESDGSYLGVALGRAVRVRREGGGFFVSGTVDDFEAVWREYFDLDRDYGAIRRLVSIDGYMTAAAGCGAGLRILRQDPWEALCSFILSSCNNIPRIKKIIERLCRLFGEPVCFGDRVYYTFPAAEKLAGLSPEDLSPCRCGYRAESVLDAARAVAGGRLDLGALSKSTPEEARAALKTIRGVGAKVAGCVMLFGLHMLDSFPMDTWIKKVINTRYGGVFDPTVFSPYAGIAQQYMFYYARSGGGRRQSA